MERYLIDTNVILRFLTKDNIKLFNESYKIFKSIESKQIYAYIPDFIIAEVVYVLKRIYKIPKKKIVESIQQLLMLENLNTDNKLVTFEALEIYYHKNIDFADALIWAKKRLEKYKIISFDNDLKKC